MNKSIRTGCVFSLAVQTAWGARAPWEPAVDGCADCALYKGACLVEGAEKQAPPTQLSGHWVSSELTS